MRNDPHPLTPSPLRKEGEDAGVVAGEGLRGEVTNQQGIGCKIRGGVMSDNMLPKTVQIGALRYGVREVEDLRSREDDGVKLNGDIVYDSAEMRIEQAMADDVKLATIWHEVVHGLLDQAGYAVHPEQMIIALGYGLLRLVRENPDLMAKTMNATIISPPVPVSIDKDGETGGLRVTITPPPVKKDGPASG